MAVMVLGAALRKRIRFADVLQALHAHACHLQGDAAGLPRHVDAGLPWRVGFPAICIAPAYVRFIGPIPRLDRDLLSVAVEPLNAVGDGVVVPALNESLPDPKPVAGLAVGTGQPRISIALAVMHPRPRGAVVAFFDLVMGFHLHHPPRLRLRASQQRAHHGAVEKYWS